MPTAFSLFSGAGGCSLGLTQAGFDVKLAADIDANACASYAANLGSGAIWRVDLAAIGPDALLARSGLSAAQVDLIVGGPPCQGFSSAGARDWADPRNTLLRRFVEVVKAIKPTWFVMENVEGLLTADDGFYLIEAVTQLLAVGYWVRAKKVYMEEYGLPQRRKRVIVVGNLAESEFAFPTPNYHLWKQPTLFDSCPQLCVLDAISDLPAATESGIVNYTAPPLCAYQAGLRREDNRAVLHHQVKRVNEVTQQRITHLPQGATMKSLPPELQHPSFTRRAFRRVMDGTPTERRGGAPAGLKRLVADQPALTITSAAPTEFIHPLEDRILTLRECARIQSFPDWYEFSGTWGVVATQIGNAIPPAFMFTLAQHIANTAAWHRAGNPTGRWLGIDASRSTGMSPALLKMLAALEERTYAYSR